MASYADVVRLLSQQGSVSVSALFMLLTKDRTRYVSSDQEESKRVSGIMGQVPARDLAILLQHLAQDTVIGPFVTVEHELREGSILGWFFRGMFAGGNPDLAVISTPRPEEP